MNYHPDGDYDSVETMKVIDRLPPSWRQVVYDYGFQRAMQKLNELKSPEQAREELAAEVPPLKK